MSVRVKICGLTRLEDALHAEACGAHALGFIFWEHSPRAVTPAAAAAIIAALHPFTVKVGVFVNEETGRINEIAERCRLDRIQLPGGEPYETLAALNRPAYRAFRLTDEAAPSAAVQAPDRWRLVRTPALDARAGPDGLVELGHISGSTGQIQDTADGGQGDEKEPFPPRQSTAWPHEEERDQNHHAEPGKRSRCGRLNLHRADHPREPEHSQDIEDIATDDVPQADSVAPLHYSGQRSRELGKGGSRGDDGDADHPIAETQ